MNNNAWFKKENPFQTVIGLGGGATGFGAYSSAAAKTYVDEVFSTYLHTGTGATKTITNGIDLSTEGGMVWQKCRTLTQENLLIDSERGLTKAIKSNSDSGQFTASTSITSFNSDGFTLGSYGDSNQSNQDYATWTSRKAPGWFDIVTWTGTSGYRTLDHSLECIPGFIMIKKTSGSESWLVWHRVMGSGSNPHYLRLNESYAMGTDGGGGSNPNASVNSVSSTQFTVGADNNGSGGTWVAYLFAGGDSDAATARSLDFDGSNDYLTTSTSSDYDLGTGDFTLECWIKPSNNNDWKAIADKRTGSDDKFLFYLDASSSGNYRKLKFWSNGSDRIASGDYAIVDNQWNHVAIVRNSASTRIYANGTQVGSTYSDTTDYDHQELRIGDAYNGSQSLNGAISNFRLVKGTAVYTSSFKPPTEPLTSISGTVLLCCNNSSVTGTTTGTITATGNVAASTASPFDDSNGFKFGSSGEGIIKCGSYKGNGESVGPTINCGWEPQWIMVKNKDATGNWFMFDSMRGIRTGGGAGGAGNGYDAKVHANETNSEESDADWLELTPTGFQIVNTNSNVNSDAGNYIYVAIRRPDGSVSKPASAGTDVFALTYGQNSGVAPMFVTSNVDVIDFKFYKDPVSGGSWYTSARLIEQDYWYTQSNGAPGTDTNEMYDYSNGMGAWTNDGTAVLGYLWKRHAGFDVVAYEGDGVDGGIIKHSMNQAPEMIWIKNRTSSSNTGDWMVGHKDLNAGSSPWNYYLVLNKAQHEYSDSNPFNNVAPTSTSFALDSWDRVNQSGSYYLAMLFSSVTGISKVGSYTGSSSEQTITTGFQPRFVIIKNRTNTGNNWTTGWFTFDTTRGWASGNNDKRMRLNDTAAQSTEDWTNPISTGFTINADAGNQLNNNGEGYIYYAHA